MARYADYAFFLATLGRDETISLTDREHSDEPDPALAEEHLESACSEADAYIGQRYAVPLTTVPKFLRTKIVDLAVYSLARGAGLMSDDIRERYKDAIRFLKDVAADKATLGDAEPLSGAGAGADGSGDVMFVAPEESEMTRAKLKGM